MSSRTSPQLAQRLTAEITHYLSLSELYSAKVRGLPNRDALYQEVFDKWADPAAEGLIKPPPGDSIKRDEYMAKCNAICQSTPVTPQEIIFAALAATEVIIDEDLSEFSDSERDQVLGEVGPRVFEAAVRFDPSIQTLPASPDSMNPQLPLNLVPVFFPEAEELPANESDLFGQTIRYRDRSGRVRECTVDDYGTSHLKGDWFYVTYDGKDGTEVTASEMKDILANQVKE